MPRLSDVPRDSAIFIDANIFLLLTNDAIHLAVLRAHRLQHLASADHDFRRIPRLTLWAP